MSKRTNNYFQNDSAVKTMAFAAIAIVLILTLGFLIYTGKLGYRDPNAMYGNESGTNTGSGSNTGTGANSGTGTRSNTTNTTNPGSSGQNGQDGQNGENTDGSGLPLDVQISIDPNQPAARVETKNPNVNVDTNNLGDLGL